ncbi:MAG: signal peptide peptidase SppA, partial [Verrucomicrobiia bacterium]
MKRAFGCLTIFLLMALALSVFLNLILLASKSSSLGKTPADFEEIHLFGDPHSSDKIAVIDISGIISASSPGEVYSTQLDDYTFMLRQALNDPATKAIVLRIDSPGGEVTASDILYHAVANADQEKPVVAFLQSIGTSGAYYTAIGARHISANTQTLTGSIGVLLQTFNMESLANKIGISLVTFKSGDLKDLLNPLRPVTEIERSLFQTLINESYDRFVSLVAERRNLPLN